MNSHVNAAHIDQNSIKHDEDIMRDIHHQLQHTLHNCFSAGDGWNYIKTKGGKTQKSEKSYKTVVKDVIVSLGGVIVREAGSQQKNDMTVLWPNGQQVVYELKKKDSKKGSTCATIQCLTKIPCIYSSIPDFKRSKSART